MAEPISGESSPGEPGDKEFEPTADMMVHDFDDERTLDEEEAMEGGEDPQSELSNLQKEGDMPLEDLLAMYGYNEGADASQSSSSEEILSNQDLTLDKEEIGRDLLGEGKEDGEEEDEEGDKEAGEETKPEQEEVAEEKEGGEKAEPMEVEEGEAEGESQAKEADVEVEEEEEDEKEEPSQLHLLCPDLQPAAGTSAEGGSDAPRVLRSGSRQISDEEEEEEEDYDYSPDDDDDWKKTIMVGSDYQAPIPEGLSKYVDSRPPYHHEDKLLWDPNPVTEMDVEAYLTSLSTAPSSVPSSGTAAVNHIPTGAHVRDDEQALYLLLQCGHNMEEALRRQRMNSVPLTDTMSLWSEEECRNFENGLRTYGKDFHRIQQNKLVTRSVGELVQFYYLWKKTERHDVFANKTRVEKKKYAMHPGITDYMDRFLDEGDNNAPSSTMPITRGMAMEHTSPNVHSLIYGDPKRQQRIQDQISQQHMSASAAAVATSPPIVVPPFTAEVEDRLSPPPQQAVEDLSRQLGSDGLESLVKFAAEEMANGVVASSSSSGAAEVKNVEMSVTSASVATTATMETSMGSELMATAEPVAQ